jgi:DNA (cytosine-5)-methyltransferase 1
LPTKKQFDSSEIFGEKLPITRNRFQNLNELNDFFIFCDTRNGHTTIHSWDIIKTSEREKSICLTILQNRRKKIYGNSDGNPLSLSDLKALIKDIKVQELDSLIKKKILRFVDGDNGGYEFINSKNSSGINGIYRVYLPHSSNFSTLTATGTKDMIALKSVDGNSPEEYKANFINEIIKKKLYRPLFGKEAGRLQGFPDWFVMHKDERIAIKQFGNAVSTSVILNLGKSLIETNIFRSAK